MKLLKWAIIVVVCALALKFAVLAFSLLFPFMIIVIVAILLFKIGTKLFGS